jgi:hypothetical protein
MLFSVGSVDVVPGLATYKSLVLVLFEFDVELGDPLFRDATLPQRIVYQSGKDLADTTAREVEEQIRMGVIAKAFALLKNQTPSRPAVKFASPKPVYFMIL